MKSQDLNRSNHSVFKIQVHLVLVSKYRRKVINKQMLKRLNDIFLSLCEKWSITLIEFNSESDHVHLLLDLSPEIQPSKLVNNFKMVSSRLIRKEFKQHIDKFYWKPVFWSRSYCMLSVGGAPLSVLKKYIQNQQEI